MHAARPCRLQRRPAPPHAGLAGAAALLLCLGAQAAGASAPRVGYSSIKESDCKPVAAALATHYQARGLTAQQCPGLPGLPLLVVSSDERSWLEWTAGSRVISTEASLRDRTDFGHFPNLGAERVEWSVGADGKAQGLIFRVAAQDPENASRSRSRLFVVAWLADGQARYCGHHATNEGARRLLSLPEACREALPSHPLAPAR